jgi:hypothetical protein
MCVCVCSGVRTFWLPALVSQWPPLTKNYDFKQWHWFIELPFFCFDNLKFEDLRKIKFFSSKIFIFAHITTSAFCCPGLLQHWRLRSSTLATTLSKSINFNCITVFFRVVWWKWYLFLRSPLEFESAPNHCLLKPPPSPYALAFILYQSGQPRISKLYMLTSNALTT